MMTIQFPPDYTALFSVTDRLGIDLAGAIRDGQCSPADLSRMMARCSDCWHSRKCAQWQHDTRGTRQEAMAPFCPSADDLAALTRPADAVASRPNPARPVSLAAVRGRIIAQRQNAHA